jgi:hypothetical protein
MTCMPDLMLINLDNKKKIITQHSSIQFRMFLLSRKFIIDAMLCMWQGLMITYRFILPVTFDVHLQMTFSMMCFELLIDVKIGFRSDKQNWLVLHLIRIIEIRNRPADIGDIHMTDDEIKFDKKKEILSAFFFLLFYCIWQNTEKKFKILTVVCVSFCLFEDTNELYVNYHYNI